MDDASKNEIAAAVSYWRSLLATKGCASEDFTNKFSTLVSDRLCGHWFPNTPSRGQGYRAIMIHRYGRVDSILLQSGIADPFEYFDDELVDLTMFVDPGEVVVRMCFEYNPGQPVDTVLWTSKAAVQVPRKLSDTQPSSNSTTASSQSAETPLSSNTNQPLPTSSQSKSSPSNTVPLSAEAKTFSPTPRNFTSQPNMPTTHSRAVTWSPTHSIAPAKA